MNTIAEKIHLIESLSPNPSATVRLLEKVIHCLAEEEYRKLSELRDNLREFEVRYGLDTTEFQQRFNAGELGDNPDFFEWDSLADMTTRLADKLAALNEKTKHVR